MTTSARLDVTDVQRFTLGPDDWLAITLGHIPTAGDIEVAARLAEHMQLEPGRVIVLSPGSKIAIISPGSKIAIIEAGGGVDTSHPTLDDDRGDTPPPPPTTGATTDNPAAANNGVGDTTTGTR